MIIYGYIAILFCIHKKSLGIATNAFDKNTKAKDEILTCIGL